jgi:hypothetical protein
VPEIQDGENMTFPRTLKLASDKVAKGKWRQRMHRRDMSSTFQSGLMVAAGGCLEWNYVQPQRRESMVRDSKTTC